MTGSGDGFIQANPAKLVGRVKRVQEEVAALKDLCRDLLAQKQVSQIPSSNPPHILLGLLIP